MTTANTRLGSFEPIQKPKHTEQHVTQNVLDMTSGGLGGLLPPKIFVQPFRVALKRDDKIAWIEIRSLSGLRNVTEQLERGELTELGRFQSLEMQLWGHLAEHSGFLQVQGCASTLAAGIQPLGAGPAALATDLAAIMGGTDMDALNALGAMQETLKGKPIDRTPMVQPPVTNEFVKPDGVNYTEAGEDALRQLILDNKQQVLCPPGGHKENTAFQKTAENAIQIFRETPEPTCSEIAQEIQEQIDCEVTGEGGSCKRNAIPPTGPVKTGNEAAMTGRLVADTARGLDNKQDAKIQEFATKAAELALGDETTPELTEVSPEPHKTHTVYGGKFDPYPEVDPKTLVPGLEEFGVSIAELKKLSGVPLKPVSQLPGSAGTVAKLDYGKLVDQSDIEALSPVAHAQHQELVADLERRRRDAVSKGIKLAEQQRGPASMDVYRDEARRLTGLDTPTHKAKQDPFFDNLTRHDPKDEPKSNDQDEDAL